MNPSIARWSTLAAGSFIYLGIFVFQLWGIPLVPFHPDESTQLYMSADFEQLIHAPYSMTWSAERSSDQRQVYRELDAPLTRYLVGFGLILLRRSPLPVDWEWSQSWEENRLSGALPDRDLLQVGRLVTTTLLPVAMIFGFLTGRKLGNSLAGFIAGLLIGLNALTLLHGRRVMAESALLMGTAFALWGILKGYQYPWLAALSAVIALNAKQSAIPLVPVSVLSTLWAAGGSKINPRSLLLNLLQFGLVFVAGFYLLNPLLWKNPLQAFQASWEARRNLVARQVDQSLPEGTASTQMKLGRRLAVLTANLYLNPPMFEEVGNYTSEIQPAGRQYLEIFGHDAGRGIAGGGLLLFLTLAGIAGGILESLRSRGSRRRNYTLILLAMTFQLAFLILWVPLPWQRYVVPLIPYACLWPAGAVYQAISKKGSSG